MKIKCNKNGDGSQIGIEGELSIYHVAEAKEQLLALVEQAQQLDFDLSRVSEVDSAGLQLLILLKREASERGNEMRIVGHSQPLVDLIQLFDLAAYFGDPVLLTEEVEETT